MRTRRRITAAATVAFFLSINGRAVPAAEIKYRGIPPGFDFPADTQRLLEYRDKVDVAAMRKHAWMMWAGLTYQASPGEAAAFETWYSVPRTYAGEPEKIPAMRAMREQFETPRQFFNFKRSESPGESRLTQILFDREAYEYIRGNKMYLRQTYDDLNARFNAEHTPPAQRTVPPFPNAAVSLKTVWWPVRGTGISPVPVWDDDPQEPVHSGLGNPQDPKGNSPDNWKRVVAVVAPGTPMPHRGRVTMNFNGKMRPDSRAVPLSDFYSFRITPQILKAIDNAQIDQFGDVQVGDYAVLVGMHVTTREIPDWVWATYWWHDRPNEGPFAANRPPQVRGVWRHYVMNTTLSMDTPREPDGGPKIIYNPYIEGKFSDGLLSNCMTCHNRSIYASLGEEFCGALPVTRGSSDFPPNDPRRDTRVKLEFLWSLLFRPQPLVPCARGGSG